MKSRVMGRSGEGSMIRVLLYMGLIEGRSFVLLANGVLGEIHE
jgi:Fe2+ transport system protein FeoA